MSTLTKAIGMFFISIVIMVLMVTVLLGFMLGFGHPLPWVIIGVLLIVPIIHNRWMVNKPLEWTQSMATGVEFVDKDHKVLIELINKFQEATEFNVAPHEIQYCLDEIVRYTKYHFAREERLMQMNQYPEEKFKQHCQQHLIMIEKVSQCVEEYRQDQNLAIDHILQFLRTWLMQHIAGSDQEYVPYIRDSELPDEGNREKDHV